MRSLKQRLGARLIPRLPVHPWVFRTFRVELNAMIVRLLNSVDPGRITRFRALRGRQGVLVNVGCGPFGKDGWINLDLFPAPGVTMRVDCRRALPLGDGAARGLHVEHYFEHLDPSLECPRFLAECRRCLEPGGILRIVVPDMRKYVEAYLATDWTMRNHIGSGGDLPQATFATKMEALNHVFVQDGEHYGGFDADYLRRTLERAGFADVAQSIGAKAVFPAGPSTADSIGSIRCTWRPAADAPQSFQIVWPIPWTGRAVPSSLDGELPVPNEKDVGNAAGARAASMRAAERFIIRFHEPVAVSWARMFGVTVFYDDYPDAGSRPSCWLPPSPLLHILRRPASSWPGNGLR